ncbi:DUF805 domain-containing protein [Hymenobacter sp. UV11]|uniref:DUF805 domain-containing protein n=1 Tax=Hymenobacter sp. UV11 TaxID=1849735 RepID=UPI00105FD5CB|nr:DUF805 domain-containing protein [Hymenobacter sp. UV11]TDN40330.1 hypothetical protein A8B98_12855 [Hymenobacter sp. UV11]TFZ66669.1 DUF805 domain-containing protein [Hymenobacter sp. UV11]
MKHYFTVLRKYASVEGRASRAEYWNFLLFNYIVSFILAIIEARVHTHFIVITYAVAMFLPGLAVGMRRMHDLGKYGIYALIPVYSHLLACFPGSKGANAYNFHPQR